jgi:enterochelin esterase-like enzyme
MKQFFKGNLLPVVLCCFFSGWYQTAYCQSPSDNPYATAYKNNKHWTNQVKWNKITEANEVPKLIDADNNVDSATWVTTVQSIAANGGGVLHFLSGTYIFKFDVPLYDGVIIRGDDPNTEAEKAEDMLPTHFLFPRVILDRWTSNPGNDVVSFVPRVIYNASPKAKWMGLVNLDINRAAILLDGSQQLLGKNAVAETKVTPYTVDNVLLMGIRQNNAAVLDPSIPTAIQQGIGQVWQIWPLKKVANINISFTTHCLVAKCILNDAITDDIMQYDFVTDDSMRFDGSYAQFKFADHAGIKIRSNMAGGVKNLPTAEVIDNTISVLKGNSTMITDGAALVAKTNQESFIIPERENMVIDGRTSTGKPYDLVYKDEYPSEDLVFYSRYNDTLPYRLIKPENYDPAKKYPLVVFMHDYWEKGSDNRKQVRQFVWQLLTKENREKYPCFIIAPQLPQSEPRWKTEGMGSETWPIQCTAMLVDEMVQKFSVDPSRVYAMGNSMGGAGALNMAMLYPNKFAAVVSVSMFYIFTKNMAIQAGKTPLWLVYGDQEERIRPDKRLSTKTDLKAHAKNFRYTELKGMGHRCWNQVVEKIPELLPWVFSQRTNAVKNNAE